MIGRAPCAIELIGCSPAGSIGHANVVKIVIVDSHFELSRRLHLADFLGILDALLRRASAVIAGALVDTL